MGIAIVIALAVAIVAAAYFVHKRSRSEVRSVDDFKAGLEKISPDSMPEASSDDPHAPDTY